MANESSNEGFRKTSVVQVENILNDVVAALDSAKDNQEQRAVLTQKGLERGTEN